MASSSRSNKLIATEKQLLEEIEDCILLNDLSNIEELDIIEDYIDELTTLYKRYRCNLKDELSVDEYKKVYENSKGSKEVIDEIKKAKLVKSKLKRAQEERIRKEQEAREDRIRKEQEDREEARENRLRKERMEEVSRREEREREHRITKLRDEIDAYLCKIDVIVKSNPISHVALIEDLRLYIGKLSEYSASYYHLVSKLKGLVNSSDTEYQPKLDYVLDYIYSGNEKIDALMKEANMEGIIRAEKEKAELVEKENMREIARREKEELISNRMLNEIIVIEMELSEV